MKRLVLALTVLSLSGCGHFVTRQSDISRTFNDGKLVSEREIRTGAKALTFFEGKSQLANFKATQTDKTQSATVGNLNQEITATNLVPIVKAITDGVVSGLTKSVVPIP